jgi:hypothetical protein
MLHAFREKHAGIMKEVPEEVLTNAALLRLSQSNVSTEAEVLQLAGPSTKILELWKQPLLRLLTEREAFFDKLEEAQCNRCMKFGHTAKLCDNLRNKESRKRYYKEHPEKKTIRNRNSRHKKNRNKRLKLVNESQIQDQSDDASISSGSFSPSTS